MAAVGVKEEFSFDLRTQGRYAVQSCRQHCQGEGVCSWDPIWTSLATDITVGLYLNLDINLGL